jgi:hypothetical protein
MPPEKLCRGCCDPAGTAMIPATRPIPVTEHSTIAGYLPAVATFFDTGDFDDIAEFRRLISQLLPAGRRRHGAIQVALQKVLQAGTVLSSPRPGAPASATRGSLVLTSRPFPATESSHF